MVMGHWGRSHAARKAPPIDLAELDSAPIPQTAECARCETTVILAGGKLPKDWVEQDGEAFCPDDAPVTAAIAQADSVRRNRAIDTRVHHVAIGRKGTVYAGCRIGHELVAGMAAIEIRAGASAPKVVDPRVNFLADRKALDELIQALCDIRKDLPSEGVRGTAEKGDRHG